MLNAFALESPPQPSVVTLDQIDHQSICQSIASQRFFHWANVQSPSDDELLQFARQFKAFGYGGILKWNDQELFRLQVDPAKDNYIFSSERVPFHWDGAFFTEPSLLIFYCDRASTSGGETFFVDSAAVYQDFFANDVLEQLELTIQTEKKVHYGGQRTLAIKQLHPRSGEPILRLAEQVVTDRNPVSIVYSSSEQIDHVGMADRLIAACYASSTYREHQWQAGDLLILDNHALLHGRNAFTAEGERLIRRVQVL